MSSLKDAIVVLLSNEQAARGWTASGREGFNGVRIEAAYSLVPEQTVARRYDSPDEQAARGTLERAWQAFVARREDFELPAAQRGSASQKLDERMAELHGAHRLLRAHRTSSLPQAIPAPAQGLDERELAPTQPRPRSIHQITESPSSITMTEASSSRPGPPVPRSSSEVSRSTSSGSRGAAVPR